MNHAAVVLLKLATARDYAAPCSIFLKALLNKKYTLPYRVIDALVDYFVRFADAAHTTSEDGQGQTLPVLWHQSLLVFAQRYKEVRVCGHVCLCFGERGWGWGWGWDGGGPAHFIIIIMID